MHSEIPEILELLSRVTRRLAPDSKEIDEWFKTHSPSSGVADLLKDLPMTMLRVLSAIGSLEPAKGALISEKFGIPKGTVSKAARALQSKMLITAEPVPNNKKEVHFRLTPLGKELNEVHKAFDQQMERGFIRFLGQYNQKQLATLVTVLEAATSASFLQLGASEKT